MKIIDILPYTMDHNSLCKGYGEGMEVLVGCSMIDEFGFGWYMEEETFYDYLCPMLIEATPILNECDKKN